ncbi:hypothetical protein GAGA_0565 [Paraglaciecola agarilytica NO2]|uniref:Uncharacterized protein n=1 Tax=Paraglaciecola agarilytica NO2 TaxID=1125747 RepID=A0ABQ0I286_9ALTE|nr:hypothetical protein GAGA_0565 [Paraglaciecola agarilytica NO2]
MTENVSLPAPSNIKEKYVISRILMKLISYQVRMKKHSDI